MIQLNVEEQRIAKKILSIKTESGSHSPSIFSILERVPEVNIKVDACFLSNPYATSLFLRYLKKDLIDTGKLRDVLEFYPSQNRAIAEIISNLINMPKENIFVGNGATEIIQAVMHNFVEKKIVVSIPTFSPFYEFARDDTEMVFYKFRKEKDFLLVADEYIDFVKKVRPDSIVIINPNNPSGSYLTYNELRYILTNLREVKNVILDESFIEFAFEDERYTRLSAMCLFYDFPNLMVIKSMSKDFGIAGIRAGYAVMDKEKVSKLLKNGYLWNSNGLSEYFFKLITRSDFIKEYEDVRKMYIIETHNFFKELAKLPKLKVYPSKANFVLVELLDGSRSIDFVLKLLVKYGVYVRTGNDKIGLEGEFVRISARTKEENQIIIEAIEDLLCSSE